MGAIQNSINGALGAAAVAGRMIGAEKESALVAGLRGAENVAKVGDEMPELKKELESVNEVSTNINKETEALGDLKITSPDDAKAWNDLAQGLDKDRQMAAVAMKTVEAKIKARTELLKRSQKAVERANMWGGMK